MPSQKPSTASARPSACRRFHRGQHDLGDVVAIAALVFGGSGMGAKKVVRTRTGRNVPSLRAARSIFSSFSTSRP